MLRRFSIGLLASAIAMAPLPAKAQDGTAEDLGVMRISLADVVKPTIGFQGALQVQEHQTKLALVVSCLSLLARTAFGLLLNAKNGWVCCFRDKILISPFCF